MYKKITFVLCLIAASIGIAMEKAGNPPTRDPKVIATVLTLDLRIKYVRLNKALTALKAFETLNETQQKELKDIITEAEQSKARIQPYSKPIADAFQKIIDEATVLLSKTEPATTK